MRGVVRLHPQGLVPLPAPLAQRRLPQRLRGGQVQGDGRARRFSRPRAARAEGQVPVPRHRIEVRQERPVRASESLPKGFRGNRGEVRRVQVAGGVQGGR